METKLIFMLGCGRSGSTLLESVMQSSFEITALGEVTYIWEKGVIKNENCSCGARFLDCPFWSQVVRDAVGTVSEKDALQFDASFRRARGKLISVGPAMGHFHRPEPLFAELATALYSSAAKIGQGRPILDSSKTPAFAAAVHELGVGKFGGLHVFRDACGNVQSLMTPKQRPHATDPEDAEIHPSRSVLHAIARWSILNRQARQLVRKLEDDCATVFYEQFCETPGEALAALEHGFGLVRRKSDAEGTWHSVSGNPMRFDPQGSRIRLDDRWRTSMRPLDRYLTRFLTGIQQAKLEAAAATWLREASPGTDSVNGNPKVFAS